MNLSNATLLMALATAALNMGTTVAKSTSKAPKAPKAVKAKVSKSGKSKKSGKSGKSEKPAASTLVATVESSTGAIGSTAPIGTASIHCNPNGSFLFQLDMENLDPLCTTTDQCSVSIQDGTDCASTGTDLGLNWSTGLYYTYGEGSTSSAFTINTSVDFSDNEGKVVVVKDSTNSPTACGILNPPPMKKELKASIGLYPGYEPAAGDPNPSGTVTVSFRDDDSFEFAYDLEGLMPNCQGCGIHIHAGQSCTDADLVLGHGWNQYVVSDLWTAAGGAYYNSDDAGRSDSSFNLYTGFGYEENRHHAVVVHTGNGARVGCGRLHNH